MLNNQVVSAAASTETSCTVE